MYDKNSLSFMTEHHPSQTGSKKFPYLKTGLNKFVKIKISFVKIENIFKILYNYFIFLLSISI